MNYKGMTFKLRLTKRLQNMVKVWCEQGTGSHYLFMLLLFNEIILNPYALEFSYPKNPKMYMLDPILVTLLKMEPHCGQSC